MLCSKRIVFAAILFLSGCSVVDGEMKENNKNIVIEICDEKISLNELVRNGNYYTTDEYCFLALSDENMPDSAAHKYRVNEYVNGLLLSQARTVFYLGDDPSGFEEHIDLTFASFSGQLTLAGSLYRLTEGVNTGIYFTPNSDEWKGFPLIYGKINESVPTFWVSNTEDCEFIEIPNDGTGVQAKVTIDNILLKWNNGSASGSPDTAEVIAIEKILTESE